MPESDDPFDSSKVIQAPVKKHSPEEEKYLKEKPENHKLFEEEEEVHAKEWSREGDNFSNHFYTMCIKDFDDLNMIKICHK